MVNSIPSLDVEMKLDAYKQPDQESNDGNCYEIVGKIPRQKWETTLLLPDTKGAYVIAWGLWRWL